MTFKKQAVASLAVAALLVVSMGFMNFAWAGMMRTTEDSQDEEVEQSAPLATGFGSWGKNSYVTTCAEAQNTINSVNGSAAVRITEDCTANLVIPSGRTIYLTLYSEGPEPTVPEVPDPNPEETEEQLATLSEEDETTEPKIVRTYHHLTNDGGDTITVATGATLYYEGSGDNNEYLSNTTKDKGIINNSGTTYILSGNLRAENEAKTFRNTGELNILGGNYAGLALHIDGGKVRVAGGTSNDVDIFKTYIVPGWKIEGDSVVSALPENYSLLQYLQLPSLENKYPVGYSTFVKSDYAEYLDMMEAKISSSDESILQVTGSNLDGWTLTVVGAGEAELISSMIYAGGTDPFHSYQITANAENMSDEFVNSLLDKYPEEVRQAVEAGKTISVNLEATEIHVNSLDGTQKTQILELAGEDKIAEYYNITLSINGKKDDETATKIVEVTDLGDEKVEIRLQANFSLEQTLETGYNRVYYVIRYHNDVAEKIDVSEVKLEEVGEGEDKYEELVFSSGKFSTYAVVYKDTKIDTGNSGNENPENPGDDNPENPGDGDNSGSGNNNGNNPGNDNSGDNNPGSGNKPNPDDDDSNPSNDPGSNLGAGSNAGPSTNPDQDNNNSGSNSSSSNNSSAVNNVDSNLNSGSSANNSSSNGSSNGSSATTSGNGNSNSGVKAPDTGVFAYLGDSETRMMIIEVAAAAVAGGLFSYVILAKRRR